MSNQSESVGSLEKSSVQKLMKLKQDGDLEFSDDSITVEDVIDRDHGETREEIFGSIQRLSEELNGEELDIFDDVGQQLFEKGIMTKYIVDLNKQRLGEFLHPKCSWELLQKRYGGGMYRVICKYQDQSGKWQYFKSSSKNLMEAVAIDDEAENREEKNAQPIAQSVDAKEVLSIFRDITEEKDRKYYSEMEKLNRIAKEEAEKREKLVMELSQNKNNGNDNLVNLLTVLTPLLTPMLSNKKDESTDVMMKLHQMQQDQARENLKIQQENQKQQMEMMKAMIDQSQKSTSDMISTLSSSFSSALERLADKQEVPEVNGVSWPQHMKELREAEERGYEKHKDIMELVELKASQKADDNDGEESVTSTLIKNLLPVVMQSGIMAPKVVNVPKPTLPPPPVSHSERRSLPPISNPQSVRSGTTKANANGQNSTNIKSSHQSNQSSQTKTINSMKVKANGIDSLTESSPVAKNSVVDKSLDRNIINAKNSANISNAVKTGVMEAIAAGATKEEDVVEFILNQLDAFNVDKTRIEIDFTTHHLDNLLSEFNIDDPAQKEGIYALYDQVKRIVKQ